MGAKRRYDLKKKQTYQKIYGTIEDRGRQRETQTDTETDIKQTDGLDPLNLPCFMQGM